KSSSGHHKSEESPYINGLSAPYSCLLIELLRDTSLNLNRRRLCLKEKTPEASSALGPLGCLINGRNELD
ncbi:MAG: hypothetical protein P8P29_01360, partial [Flavobacteriaceae bacterium]|nr:hypothetical protein [Flavobacteriaceae bacterium]